MTKGIIVNKTAQRDKKARAKARNRKQRAHCRWGLTNRRFSSPRRPGWEWAIEERCLWGRPRCCLAEKISMDCKKNILQSRAKVAIHRYLRECWRTAGTSRQVHPCSCKCTRTMPRRPCLLSCAIKMKDSRRSLESAEFANSGINANTMSTSGQSWITRRAENARGQCRTDEPEDDSPGSYQEITFPPRFEEDDVIVATSSTTRRSKSRLRSAASERAFVRVVWFFSAQALVVSKIVLHVGSTPFVSWMNERMNGSTPRQRPPSDRLAYTEDWARTLRISRRCLPLCWFVPARRYFMPPCRAADKGTTDAVAIECAITFSETRVASSVAPFALALLVTPLLCSVIRFCFCVYRSTTYHNVAMTGALRHTAPFIAVGHVTTLRPWAEVRGNVWSACDRRGQSMYVGIKKQSHTPESAE